MIKIIVNIMLAVVLLQINRSSVNDQVKQVESWKMGTSSGLFNDFSQEEFNLFKKEGIDYIELSSGIFSNKTRSEKEALVSELKKKADESGIKVWSIHLPFGRTLDVSNQNEAEKNNMIKECSDLMVLCKPLMPQKYIIHPSAEPITAEERPKRLITGIASLKILNETAKQNNARLAVECLPRTCLGNTADELLTIVNEVGGGIGICFDSNHLLKEKPEQFVAKTGNLIVTVHISDYDGLDEKHWLPGTGVINWTKVIAELAKSGYNGPFMYETSKRKPSQEPTSEPVKLTAKDLYDNFTELKSDFLKSSGVN
jgi:sugar phosphate isomerase/epimerase